MSIESSYVCMKSRIDEVQPPTTTEAPIGEGLRVECAVGVALLISNCPMQGIGYCLFIQVRKFRQGGKE